MHGFLCISESSRQLATKESDMSDLLNDRREEIHRKVVAAPVYPASGTCEACGYSMAHNWLVLVYDDYHEVG